MKNANPRQRKRKKKGNTVPTALKTHQEKKGGEPAVDLHEKEERAQSGPSDASLLCEGGGKKHQSSSFLSRSQLSALSKKGRNGAASAEKKNSRVNEIGGAM